MPGAPVRLNIYDMYWINDYASMIGVGVYHSGVEVHGVEYAYGGHPYNFSGIFENQPGEAEELGENFKFKETIHLGSTDFSPYEVKRMIQNLGEDYRGDKYHLITKNCNHFSQYLAKTLTGSDIPSWVNRLANMSGSLPFYDRWIPQEWLTPVALQQTLDEKNKESDASMNYPVAVGRDALEGYNSPGTSKRNSAAAPLKATSRQNANESVFSGAFSFFTGSKSTPNSARSNNQPTQSGFSKLWTSIKSLTDTSARPQPLTTPTNNGSAYIPANGSLPSTPSVSTSSNGSTISSTSTAVPGSFPNGDLVTARSSSSKEKLKSTEIKNDSKSSTDDENHG